MIWSLVAKAKFIAKPSIEAYLRGRDRVGLALLRVKSQGTVVGIVNADRIDGDKVVIFAAYPHESIASFHERFLEKWERRGYNIIIASHHSRAPEFLKGYVERGWCVLYRRPYGRDFGCFRDASELLYRLQAERGRAFSRIVYANDSVITLDPYEESIITHLDSPKRHFAGVTDNYDPAYHVSSYLFSVSGQVFNDVKVRKYWRKYGMLSTRGYSISRGEIGFSKTVIKSGYVAHVQWPISKLKTRLEGLSLDGISRIAESMEVHYRERNRHPLVQMANVILEFLPPSLSHWLTVKGVVSDGDSAQSPFPVEVGSLRRSIEVQPLVDLTFAQQRDVVDRVAKEQMIDSIMQYVFRGSHIHHGAAPLLFLGAGILKKDVVLRRIVEPYNVEKILRESKACNAVEMDEAMVEILSRGHPKSFRGFRRLLLKWDFI